MCTLHSSIYMMLTLTFTKSEKASKLFISSPLRALLAHWGTYFAVVTASITAFREISSSSFHHSSAIHFVCVSSKHQPSSTILPTVNSVNSLGLRMNSAIDVSVVEAEKWETERKKRTNKRKGFSLTADFCVEPWRRYSLFNVSH